MIDGPAWKPSSSRACPSCRQPMQVETYERKAEGRVELDLCYSCQAIWFDAYESSALTPGAVLKLFEAIHRRGENARGQLADVCRCPVCKRNLQVTNDLQRTTRITYYRCPDGHGRLSTFYQFLREKSFIRSLTMAEIEKLRAVVKQVRCTSCGAPVNLERDAQCSFCRAPIAILDADAVSRTLAELSAAEQKRRSVDPHAAIDSALAAQRIERRARAERYSVGFPVESGSWGNDVVDLVGEAVDFFLRLD